VFEEELLGNAASMAVVLETSWLSWKTNDL